MESCETDITSSLKYLSISNHYDDLSLDQRIILKWVLRKRIVIFMYRIHLSLVQ
jgi:hypothetical protein